MAGTPRCWCRLLALLAAALLAAPDVALGAALPEHADATTTEAAEAAEAAEHEEQAAGQVSRTPPATRASSWLTQGYATLTPIAHAAASPLSRRRPIAAARGDSAANAHLQRYTWIKRHN